MFASMLVCRGVSFGDVVLVDWIPMLCLVFISLTTVRQAGDAAVRQTGSRKIPLLTLLGILGRPMTWVL